LRLCLGFYRFFPNVLPIGVLKRFRNLVNIKDAKPVRPPQVLAYRGAAAQHQQ